jgi:tRNA G18 (ribose-2'-O)-methylase SpoU
MPTVIHIMSANATFQQIEALRRNREKRHRLGLFLVEGVRAMNLLHSTGWPIEALVYAGGVARSDWAHRLIASAAAPTHYVLAAELLARLSARQQPSEVLALAHIPADDLARLPTPPDLLAILFDRPVSPGNLGTLIRSGDALGAHGLIISGHAADLYDPETLAATTGSLFALPAVRVASPRAIEPWLAQRPGVRLVGTDEHGSVPVDAFDWRGPTVLVVGNETRGMSAQLRERCDAVVRIPIGGAASSLNVASAAAIVLYEVGRQRRGAAAGPRDEERGAR